MVFVFGVDFPLMELMFIYIALILLCSILTLIEFATLKILRKRVEYDFKKIERDVADIKKTLSKLQSKRFK